MDYKEKYEKALERARNIIRFGNPQSATANTVFEEIFPELKEKEDEKIRKWCISHFRECFRVTKDNVKYQEYLNNKVIPWLERLGGEKKPTPKFKVGDKINMINREEKDYTILTITDINLDKNCYICNQGSVINFDEEGKWYKIK